MTGDCLATFTDHFRPVYTLTFCPDGRFVATGGGDGWLYVYSTTVRLSSEPLGYNAQPHLDTQIGMVLVRRRRPAWCIRSRLADEEWVQPDITRPRGKKGDGVGLHEDSRPPVMPPL